MKKDFLIILGMIFMMSLPFVGCEHVDHNPDTTDNYQEMSAQRFFDTYVTKDSIKYNGHDLIFYETSVRGYRNYSFTIEHATDCKACLDIFD